MGAYLCVMPFISVLNFCMVLMGNSSQLCLRLQLLIDSLPCFTTLFQGYLPLQRKLSIFSYVLCIYAFLVSYMAPSTEWGSNTWIRHFGCRDKIHGINFTSSRLLKSRLLQEGKYYLIYTTILWLWIVYKLSINQYQQSRYNYCEETFSLKIQFS
jgi:hypothetical protein